MNDKLISHKNWDALEMTKSFTWRELLFVKHALQSFVYFLRVSVLNLGVVSMIMNGSSNGSRFIYISWR